jgi:hypothetical protein
MTYADCDFAAWARGDSPGDYWSGHHCAPDLRRAASFVLGAVRHAGGPYTAWANGWAFDRACELAMTGNGTPLRRLTEAHHLVGCCPFGGDERDDDPEYTERERRLALLNAELERRLIAVIAELLREPIREAKFEEWDRDWWEEYDRDAMRHYDWQRDNTNETFDEFVDSLGPGPVVIDATTDLRMLTNAIIGSWANGRVNPLVVWEQERCNWYGRGAAPPHTPPRR